MADITWESSGADDMMPKTDDDGVDRNIIPNVDEGNPTVGTVQDAWHGIAIRGSGVVPLLYTWYEYDRLMVGYNGLPSITALKGRTCIQQGNSSAAISVLHLDQKDEDQPILYIDGAEAGNQTATISTFTGGSGAVDGPTRKGGAPAGWKFVKMMKVKVNSTENEFWIPIYEKET